MNERETERDRERQKETERDRKRKTVRDRKRKEKKQKVIKIVWRRETNYRETKKKL